MVDGDRCRTDLRDPLDDPEPLRVVVGGSEYSEDGVVELVDEELPDKVTIPSVSREQESSEVFLEESDAEALLSWFRNSTRWYGTIQHTILEVTWHTGARMGGLRGLDLEDYQREEQYLLFRPRPETETTLKNKLEGERAVSISDTVADVLDYYIVRERSQKRDDHGREPLFCGRQGRVSDPDWRNKCYLATEPCHYRECPHGKSRHSCEWTDRAHASKCPSSRSSHQVRSGSITWQLNQGIPIGIVAERVTSSEDAIDATTIRRSTSRRWRNAVETTLRVPISTEKRIPTMNEITNIQNPVAQAQNRLFSLDIYFSPTQF